MAGAVEQGLRAGVKKITQKERPEEGIQQGDKYSNDAARGERHRKNGHKREDIAGKERVMVHQQGINVWKESGGRGAAASRRQ